jgi:dTMP kinase
VLYLDIDVPGLLPRVLGGRGYDYWESGQDYLEGTAVYESFVTYQSRLLEEFRGMADPYGFRTVDARGTVGEVFRSVLVEIEPLLEGILLE